VKEPRPPHDEHAERSVLAGVLLDPDRIDDVVDLVEPSDFYGPHNGLVWRALLDLDATGEPIDTLALRRWLAAANRLEEAGGEEHVLGITARIPLVANIANHAKIVRELSQVRRMVETCRRLVARGLGGVESVGDFIDEAEGAVLAVAEKHRASQTCAHVRDVVAATYRRIEEAAEAPSGITGTPTGFGRVDRMLRGMHAGDLVVLAGRPAMGKTALGMGIADHVAKRTGPVAVFSLEMPKEQLVQRLLGTDARIDTGRMRSGTLAKDDWTKLSASAARLSDSPMWIDDQGGLSPRQIRARCRRIRAQEGGLALVVIDYLQLMTPDTRYRDAREREVGDNSESCKRLAKEMGCPVLLLAQLNRECEKRANKRPQMSDLRDSGRIEQDADVVAFLYRDEVYSPKSRDAGTAEVIIGKQRNGPTGTVRLAFRPALVRFDNLADDYPDEEFDDDKPRSTLYDQPGLGGVE